MFKCLKYINDLKINFGIKKWYVVREIQIKTDLVQRDREIKFNKPETVQQFMALLSKQLLLQSVQSFNLEGFT